MYLKIILQLAEALGALSRLLGQGSGVMVAGRLILALTPNAVRTLAKGKRVILISGTNGKSTTAKLIAQTLATKYQIAHNHTGANLHPGIAQALGANPKCQVAVLEVDELVLPWAIQMCDPELVVLLNLGRDQLDRLSEVRIVAGKWRSALQGHNSKRNLKVLASSDDPFVVFAAMGASEQIWFSAGERGHIDAATCPVCGALLNWSEDRANFSCNCGFAKPEPDWQLIGDQLIDQNQGGKTQVRSAIPGQAAIQNAARALIVGSNFGIELSESGDAISKVTSVDGRFAIKRIQDTNFRLLLAKNPASWRETLQTSANGPSEVLLVVNANTQDGKDTSWLWDVDFQPLQGRRVLVSGDRRVDVSARLTVQGIAHQVVESEIAAANVFGASDADLIASYTAFHRLAKNLDQNLDQNLPNLNSPKASMNQQLKKAEYEASQASQTNKVKIVNLLPELLGTYGDQGNALTLAWRLRARGITCEVVNASAYEKLPTDGDFYLLGGGEDDAQIAAVELLREQRTLEQALDNGAQIFAVCAGFQLLGQQFPASGGRTINGLGLLPIITESANKRSVGELLLESTIGVGKLTGFENHAGQSKFVGLLKPLGTVITGIGNHDNEASDGALTDQIIATYMHGPALVRNPELADFFLSRKLGVLPKFSETGAEVFTDLHASCVARASK